jgi:hypothetical protein
MIKSYYEGQRCCRPPLRHHSVYLEATAQLRGDL